MVEVTIPILLSGSITFEVEDDAVVTPDFISTKLKQTQDLLDRGDAERDLECVIVVLGTAGAPVYREVD